MPLSRSTFLHAVATITKSGFVTVKSTNSPLLNNQDELKESKENVTEGNNINDTITREELPLPLIIEPTNPSTTTLSQTTEWISKVQSELELLLSMTGAILFRGFPTPAATDFAEFVEGFKGWKDLPYEDSLSYAVRKPVCKKVCTTNEGKTGGYIFHHELAQAPKNKFPSKILFYCENVASEGGATAITPSSLVLEDLKQKYPTFYANCKEKGIVYQSIHPAEADATHGVGRSWSSFFGRDTKEEVKARMDELGYTGTWDNDDHLHLKTPILPAIRTMPDGTEVFFNQMIAQCLANTRDFSKSGQGKGSGNVDDFLRFGDGSSIDVDALVYAHQASEKRAVELEWQNGDIGLLDNMLVMHARRPFEGPRRVYASLVI